MPRKKDAYEHDGEAINRRWTTGVLTSIGILAITPLAFFIPHSFSVGQFLLARELPFLPLIIILPATLLGQFQRGGIYPTSRRPMLLAAILPPLLFFINPFTLYASANSVISKTIFFCTDRAITDGRITDQPSDCEERDQSCVDLKLGMAEVLVPWSPHDITPPGTQLKAMPGVSTATLGKWHFLEAGEFFSEVSRAVANSPDNDGFLFVHGFRNSFEDAAATTAQLSVNLKIKGATLLFSWPSAHDRAIGAVINYGGDSLNARTGANDLADFLPTLIAQSSVKNFDILAHSAGNYVATQAIADDYKRNAFNNKIEIRNLILAAPDLPPSFFDRIAGPLRNSAKVITLYFSPHDLALWASSAIQKGSRVGSTGSRLTGIDFVNAEGLDPSPVGHFYIYQGKVLNDVFLLIHTNMPASERIDLVRDDSTGVYRFTNKEMPKPSFWSSWFN